MIWALLAWYFLGGTADSGTVLTSAGVTELQAQITVVVADEERSTRADAILERLAKNVQAFEKTFASTGKQLNKLYSDHDADQQLALDILADLNTAWQAGQQSALDDRFALRDALTEDEWILLFGGN